MCDNFEVEDKAFGRCLGTKVSLKSVAMALMRGTPCVALPLAGAQLGILFQEPVAAACEEGVGSVTVPKGKEWREVARRDEAESRGILCSLCF